MTDRVTRNRARCKACGSVIESKHRHDYVTCSCGQIAVDGGLDYLKRVWDPGEGKIDLGPDMYLEELAEFEDCPIASQETNGLFWCSRETYHDGPCAAHIRYPDSNVIEKPR